MLSFTSAAHVTGAKTKKFALARRKNKSRAILFIIAKARN
jgi:hypothetical protein